MEQEEEEYELYKNWELWLSHTDLIYIQTKYRITCILLYFYKITPTDYTKTKIPLVYEYMYTFTFQRIFGIDYFETFSPGAQLKSIWGSDFLLLCHLIGHCSSWITWESKLILLMVIYMSKQ